MKQEYSLLQAKAFLRALREEYEYVCELAEERLQAETRAFGVSSSLKLERGNGFAGSERMAGDIGRRS